MKKQPAPCRCLTRTAAAFRLVFRHFLIDRLLRHAFAQAFFRFLHRAVHGLAGDIQRIFTRFAAREIHAAQIGRVDFAFFQIDIEFGGAFQQTLLP